MMNRPRLFLSAVSTELQTVRKTITATVRTLGYDPVSQDDFPTGYGELKQWLREQIDSCEGLVQIAGLAYGAEPPEPDAEFGRVSYTQYEFLYAQRQGKKTWLILAGAGCQRDNPADKLDMPRDENHPDPDSYQAERRQLQLDYIAKLKEKNHLRHSADTDSDLELKIYKLKDELSDLRRQSRRQQQRLLILVSTVLCSILVLGGAGWWAYQHLHQSIQTVGSVTTEKIRAHLHETIAQTHNKELAAAEQETDWQQRQRLREAADAAHQQRLARIDELAASFAEIEGQGNATGVFQEMTRIIAEQGIDAAIAYVAGQRSSILQAIKARTQSVNQALNQRNRAELQPLLKTAALYESKGQTNEARGLYQDILNVEPDWPEALHQYFWFLTGQGDSALVHTTLANGLKHYSEAQRLAQRLTAIDPGNK